MTNLLKRGGTYHFNSTVAGKRLRGSLGTTDPKAAKKLASRVEFAVSDGPKSEVWSTLRMVLPRATYRTLATEMSVQASPDLIEFEILFNEQMDRREKLGEITASTHALYEAASRSFFSWAAEQNVRLMENATPTLVEKYQVWRQTQLTSKPQSKNGAGLKTDNTVLSAIFNFAVQEGVIKKSPLQGKFKAYGKKGGAEPFTAEELSKLDAATNKYDRLLFLLFRWTGLRGSDAAALDWQGFSKDFQTLTWKTIKRGTVVVIPVAEELRKALDEGYPWHNAAPDKVFENATRPKLYSIIQNLGNRAGVPNCRPHRFRDTLAVTILEKGGTIYDVAKILGDHISTVEKHYAPFTDKLQERVRKILDSEAG